MPPAKPLERSETINQMATPLWHGLLTVPPDPTAGLPETPGARDDAVETCGRRQWHGQETVPQRGGLPRITEG